MGKRDYSIISFIVCIMTFFALIITYIVLPIDHNQSQGIHNVLAVLIGAMLSASITLAIYINTLNKDKEKEEKRKEEEIGKVISNIRTLIAVNSEKSKATLLSLEDELRNIGPGYDYKMPLFDLFPFTRILIDNVRYFLDTEGISIVAISIKIEYLDKALKYREQLILNQGNTDISAKIKEQDEYLVKELKDVIESIETYEKTFLK